MTTGQKLNAIAANLGLSHLVEDYKLEESENWIERASSWLEERREREAIEAEARAAAGNVRIFRRKQ